LENLEVTAQLTAGQNLTTAILPHSVGMETWSDWKALTPLTSEWQTEPEWPHPNTV